jgi:hypothetical protein
MTLMGASQTPPGPRKPYENRGCLHPPGPPTPRGRPKPWFFRWALSEQKPCVFIGWLTRRTPLQLGGCRPPGAVPRHPRWEAAAPQPGSPGGGGRPAGGSGGSGSGSLPDVKARGGFQDTLNSASRPRAGLQGPPEISGLPESPGTPADQRFRTNLEIQAAECKPTKARHTAQQKKNTDLRPA